MNEMEARRMSVTLLNKWTKGWARSMGPIRSRTKPLAGCLLVLASASALAASPPTPAGSGVAVWPQWRGPERNGISQETGWTYQWPKEGPLVLWKRGMGCGFSSVAVVGNRLYTEGTVGETTRVFCLDAATGAEIWTYDYELPVRERGKRQFSFPGPTSTPTLDGQKVYVYSRGGQLFSFEAASGALLWAVTNKIKVDAYGLACSPLIVGDQIITLAGGSNNLAVAFDKHTGRRLWSGGDDRAAYASPVLFQHKTGPALAILGQRQIVGLSLADRKTLFVHPWPEHRNTADPVIVGDKLLAVCGATGGGKASALFRIPDAPGGLEEVCKFDTLMQLSTPPVWQGFVYGACGNVGRLPRYAQEIKFHCVEFETGKTRWGTSRLSGAATVADGKLLVLTIMGELVVIEANPDKYVELARAKVVEPWCYSAPVLANGRLYCRGSGDDITEGTMNNPMSKLKGGWLVCLDVSGRANPGAAPKVYPRLMPPGAAPQAVK